MSLCPFALQKPVSAHGGPISEIIGVVEHVTAGEGDPYNEFANPNNQVSSHFGIGNGQGGMGDGVLEQYVDTAFASWAQAAGNYTYISVETEGEPTDPLTPAQVATFGRLMGWINSDAQVPLVITDTVGTPGLILHGDGGYAWGGHFGCPGDLRAAQRPAILAASGAAPDPIPPSPPEVTTMPGISPAVVESNGQEHRTAIFLGGLGHFWRDPSTGKWGGQNVAHVADPSNGPVANIQWDPDQVPTIQIIGNWLVIGAVNTAGVGFDARQQIGTPGWGIEQVIV